MSDPDKTRYKVQMIIRNETSQMALLGTVNDCMMTVRTAMFQITTPELVKAVSSVFKNMQEQRSALPRLTKTTTGKKLYARPTMRTKQE